MVCIEFQWPPLVEVVDTWELPPILIDRYNAAGGKELLYVESFQRFAELGQQWITHCFYGDLISGMINI